MDILAVCEAGNLWLQDNGMVISEEADSETVTVTVSLDTTQAEAESMMLKACFDTVFHILEMRNELSSFSPVFNCICEVNQDTCMAEIHCYYALLPTAS